MNDSTEAIKKLKHTLAGSKAVLPCQGLKLALDGAVFEQVYSPLAEGKKGNEVCNVVKVSYGGISFLITGDLQAAAEQELVAAKTDIESAVLKVGHHGSNSSTTTEFLARVKQSYAIISVGKDNDFGHPSQEVVKRLQDFNTRIFRTDIDGAIIFAVDGKKLSVETFRQGVI